MNDFTLRQDEDGHWYRIPNELVEQFDTALNLTVGLMYMDAPDEFDDFILKFDQYRTGGDPNNIP